MDTIHKSVTVERNEELSFIFYRTTINFLIIFVEKHYMQKCRYGSPPCIKNAIRDLDLNDDRNNKNLSNGNTLKGDNFIIIHLMCHSQMSEKHASGNKLFMIAIHFFCWLHLSFMKRTRFPKI